MQGSTHIIFNDMKVVLGLKVFNSLKVFIGLKVLNGLNVFNGLRASSSLVSGSSLVLRVRMFPKSPIIINPLLMIWYNYDISKVRSLIMKNNPLYRQVILSAWVGIIFSFFLTHPLSSIVLKNLYLWHWYNMDMTTIWYGYEMEMTETD